jgi:hypothetical protein
MYHSNDLNVRDLSEDYVKEVKRVSELRNIEVIKKGKNVVLASGPRVPLRINMVITREFVT